MKETRTASIKASGEKLWNKMLDIRTKTRAETKYGQFQSNITLEQRRRHVNMPDAQFQSN